MSLNAVWLTAKHCCSYPGTESIDTQFLWGRDLLISPVLEEVSCLTYVNPPTLISWASIQICTSVFLAKRQVEPVILNTRFLMIFSFFCHTIFSCYRKIFGEKMIGKAAEHMVGISVVFDIRVQLRLMLSFPTAHGMTSKTRPCWKKWVRQNLQHHWGR